MYRSPEVIFGACGRKRRREERKGKEKKLEKEHRENGEEIYLLLYLLSEKSFFETTKMVFYRIGSKIPYGIYCSYRKQEWTPAHPYFPICSVLLYSAVYCRVHVVHAVNTGRRQIHCCAPSTTLLLLPPTCPGGMSCLWNWDGRFSRAPVRRNFDGETIS